MSMSTILIFAVAAIIGLYILRFLIKIPFYLFGIAVLCGLGWFAFYYLLPMLSK